jgi:hypothetical protein
MDNPSSLEAHLAPHPKLEVHRGRFPLDHPYLEQCWTPVLGPSKLLLRRVPWLWSEATPAEIDIGALGAQLGRGDGCHSPMGRTVERIARLLSASSSARDTRDLTLRVRDGIRGTHPSSGHTLAGFPPGNLRATRRAPGWSR